MIKLLKDAATVAAVATLVGLVASMIALAGYLFTTAPAVLP